MKYSAVVVSNSFERVRFSAEYLVENSGFCEELVIVWDGIATSSAFDRFVKYLNDKYTVHVHVICNVACEDVYGMFNHGVRNSNHQFVLLFNDDMYFPPAWDSGLDINESWLGKEIDNSVITFHLVEPGYVDVNSKNIKHNFGMTIETFDKAKFDTFAEDFMHTAQEGLGWYMPVIFPKKMFMDFGMYPVKPQFPYPNDIVFFDKLKVAGAKFVIFTSPVYHFQRLSQRESHSKYTKIAHNFDRLNLCCGDDKRDGWLNTDFADSQYNYDYLSGTISFQSETFSQVLFKHALEHFRAEVGERLVREIYRILKPGGFVDIYVPDLELAIQDFQLGYNQNPNCAPAILRIYGRNDNEQQVHKWGFTHNSLRDLLKKCEFSRIEHSIQKYANDEIAIRAYK